MLNETRAAAKNPRTAIVLGSLLLAIALVSGLSLFGCADNRPAKLLGANYFEYASGGYSSSAHPYIAVNWQNQSNKPIDYVEVNVRLFDAQGAQLSDNGKESFTVRLMEDQGVEPNQKNTQNIVDAPFDFDADPMKIEARIDRVSFSDGSTWINDDERYQEFKAGANMSSRIPVVIDEVNFYESSPNAVDRYLNIDWHNDSSDSTTLAVEFKIMGSSIPRGATEENPVTYLTLSDRVSPGGENYIWKTKFASNFLGEEAIKSAREYEISVYRVIDTDGNVWVNAEDADSVSSAFLGKKGCAFGDFDNYPQVNSLVESLNANLESYGFDYGAPEVFVKAGSHCLVRYPNLDVTVKVNSDGTLVDDWISYNMYFEPTNDGIEKAQEEYGDIGLCVLPSALTCVDEQSIKTSWEDAIYTTGNKSMSIDGRRFQIESKGGRIYDGSGGQTGVVGVCVATDPTGAFDHDWAKRYPY